MRREKKQQLKTKLISDMYSYIAEGHKLVDTAKMAERLCKFYFPNADILFIESFKTLAQIMQNKYVSDEDFDFCLRLYK